MPKPISEFLDKIICGDTLEVLKQIPSDSVDCIITSPPYWGLRDYGEATCKVWGGDPDCEHEFELEHIQRDPSKTGIISEKAKIGQGYRNYKSGFCKKCGAWYGQLGLEPTLDMYTEHLLEITAELKRVLKPTGVMFWNHGDCYGGSGCGKGDYRNNNKRSLSNPNLYCEKPNPQLKLTQKCMALQNYRLILRMVDEQGWILRNIIIWYKPNHMPESVKDRFTNAYEPVFMLTKKKRYYFDLDAVRIPHKLDFGLPKRATPNRKKWEGMQPISNHSGYYGPEGELLVNPLGKNPGDMWAIPTQPFPDAHFATFPEKLVEPMIKSTCPQGGIVLDPFAGSGTTCLVAKKLGRHYIGIDLNPEYCKMARKRLNFGTRLEDFGLVLQYNYSILTHS